MKTGTRWLSFWTNIALPIYGIFCMVGGLITLNPSTLSVRTVTHGIIGVGWSLFVLVVSLGLRHKKLWAWRANWIIVVGVSVCLSAFSSVLAYLLMPTAEPFGQATYHQRLFTNYIILAAMLLPALIWFWPNYIYFKKRRSLFQ
jgi:hypothetical protein